MHALLTLILPFEGLRKKVLRHETSTVF